VAFLLAKGANPNVRDRKNVTPWVAAVAAGSATIQATLEAAGAKPNLQGALVRASQIGNVDAVQRLIDQGVDVNSRATVGGDRVTPLEAVCANSELTTQKRLAVVECLLAKGADPNTTNKDGRPLTFRAVDQMQSDVLIALLQHGADTELQDKDSGETALLVSAEQNKTDCAKALLMADANTNVKNRKGQPVLIAMLNGEYQPHVELAKWLIAFGADVNATDSAGRTAKQYAKRIVRKRDDDDYAADQAQSILELLGNAEELASNSGVCAGSPASAEGWFARADCALAWLEELSLAVDALTGAVRADSHAISGLTERLGCDNLLMRFVATHAISALGTDAAAAAPALIERLQTEEDSNVALAVTGALAAVGPTVTEPLTECLRIGTLRIARRAAITLCKITPADCETVVDTLHKRLPADTTALTGDAMLEAAELHGICGDTYSFIDKLPEAMQEYEAAVAINPDLNTGRRQALTFVRWKLGVPPEGMIENSIGMRFAIIPNGEFMMGAPEEEPGMNAGEELLHRVRITRPFYIGACTVSQKEYSAVMDDNPSRFRGPDLPVEHVSWRQATDFCKRLSQLAEEKRTGWVYRLPTEAEWEYACRAGTSTTFSCGDTLDHDDANFCDDSVITPQPTVPLGNFPPNAFGLHEMHGNVWEWCRDWYQVDYYEQSPCDDPPGPEDGHHHVMRGGSASVMVHECRAALRGEAGGPPVDTPSDSAAQRFQRIGDFGFRVVCQVSND